MTVPTCMARRCEQPAVGTWRRPGSHVRIHLCDGHAYVFRRKGRRVVTYPRG